MKDKYITGPKGVNKFSRSTSLSYDDSSPSSPEFPHSATSTIGFGSPSPRLIPEVKYNPTLTKEDEEFLINKLKNLELPEEPSPFEREPRHIPGGPPPNPYGNFGNPMPMPAMAPVPAMAPMPAMPPMHHPVGGPLPPYAFPPMGAYGPQMPPNYGHGPHFGGPGYPVAPPAPQQAQVQPQAQPHSQGQSRRSSYSSHVSDSQRQALRALVVRREDLQLEAEVEKWKELFMKLFKSTNGWTELHCSKIIPGAVEEATSKNAKLWDYILKVAVCYKDNLAAPKHALFMLNSSAHRSQFIARLLLQYIEQELFTWRFWLGWDDETDIQLNKLGPIVDFIGHPLETRRNARKQIRHLVEGIGKDDDYMRFRQYKQSLHVGRFKDIAGSFVIPHPSHDHNVGLHSIANTAMEISMKMMTSSMSFAFTWNECGVKFCHESHIAMNSDLHGVALQHKHTRVAVVVTPSISYRDDTSRTIVPRGVSKAQVLIMN